MITPPSNAKEAFTLNVNPAALSHKGHYVKIVRAADKDVRLIRRMAQGVEPIPGQIADLLRLIMALRRWRYSGQKPDFSEKSLDTDGF